jgi:hypothetical protein
MPAAPQTVSPPDSSHTGSSSLTHSSPTAMRIMYLTIVLGALVTGVRGRAVHHGCEQWFRYMLRVPHWPSEWKHKHHIYLRVSACYLITQRLADLWPSCLKNSRHPEDHSYLLHLQQGTPRRGLVLAIDWNNPHARADDRPTRHSRRARCRLPEEREPRPLFGLVVFEHLTRSPVATHIVHSFALCAFDAV